MLKNVHLKNFKCYVDQSVPLSNLTLLSGVNSVGKSSFIHALLALEQTYNEGRIEDFLVTNGHLINIGAASDVLNENTEHEIIYFDLHYENCKNKYSFEKREASLLAPPNSKHQVPFRDGLTYLCAERTGPRSSYLIPGAEQESYNRIGNAGEYASYTLAMYGGDFVVPDNLLCPDTPKTLLSQTEAWLSRVCRPIRIQAEAFPHMDSVNLQYSFKHGKLYSSPYRSTNVGFGITYTLPIFVAVLSAHPGELLVIENPEAHLHPKGQAIMGEFLALAAAAGVQILVETHSDHVLNGVRVAVKNKKLDCDNVYVHFFSHSAEGAPQLVTPRMDSDGRFDRWPEDFFDEWDKQLAELL